MGWIAVASAGLLLLTTVTKVILRQPHSLHEVAPFLSAASFYIVGIGLVSFGVRGLLHALGSGGARPGNRSAREGAWIAWIAWIMVVAFVVGIVAVSLPRVHVNPRAPQAVQNVKNLTTLLIGASIRRGWPPHDGKNFILSLVASGAIDAQNTDNLTVFFPHADPSRTPDPAAYAEVTPESLGTRRFADLTAYAGRRNTDPRYRLPTDEDSDALEAPPEPIVADVTRSDYAIVGFTNGAVRVLDRDALGLGAQDPIVVGDASLSPILRPLSLD